MKKNFLRLSAWAMLMALAMTSCVTERDEEVASKGGGNLYINITADDISDTRGLVINTNPTTAGENYVGKSLICFYNGETLIDYTTSDDLQTLADNHSAINDITGTKYAAGNTVAVLSNLPDAVYTTVKGKLDANATTPYSLTSLKAETMTIAQALNSNVITTTDADRRIPMYGEATLAENDNDLFANVTVKHSIAKVTLKQLVVDFSESKNRGASFQPDQVFLTNVPDVTNIITSSIKTLDFDAANKLYHGDDALTYVTTTPSSATEVQYADADKKKVFIENHTDISENIIGTDVMTSGLETLNAANSTWSKSYYFYTLPNDLTTDNEISYLVVSGIYKASSSDAGSRVYYRAKLNGKTGATGKLEANYNYTVNMFIRGMGATDAFSDPITPVSVDTYVSVENFTAQDENAIFGGGAATYTDQENIVKVGDILYNDGTFLNQTDAASYSGSAVPVGIVFHLFTADELSSGNYGTYKHGLVMALKDASTGTAWGTTFTGLSQLTLTTTATDENPLTGTALATQYRTSATELKNLGTTGNCGLVNWNAVQTAGIGTGNAFEAVANFQTSNSITGLTVSDWYLPSIGELYKMCYSLGELETSTLNTTDATWGNANLTAGTHNRTWNWTPWGMFYTNGATGAGSAGVADLVRTNINDKLSAAGTGNWDAFEGGLQGVGGGGITAGASVQGVIYWSSSEWSATHALNLYFSSGGNLNFARGSSKSNELRVRPVLAF